MTNLESRLVQEVDRLGGQYAHVYEQSISPKYDEAADEAWLYDRFSYMLYRRRRTLEGRRPRHSK
jgi:hypothetical protein